VTELQPLVIPDKRLSDENQGRKPGEHPLQTCVFTEKHCPRLSHGTREGKLKRQSLREQQRLLLALRS
jgi:hypothetical protein